MGRRGKIWERGKKEKEEEESGKKCKKVLGIEGIEWGEMVGHLALGSKNEKHTQRKDFVNWRLGGAAKIQSQCVPWGVVCTSYRTDFSRQQLPESSVYPFLIPTYLWGLKCWLKNTVGLAILYIRTGR